MAPSKKKKDRPKNVSTKQQVEWVCPHCQKEGASRSQRFHFDNCKQFDETNLTREELQNYNSGIANVPTPLGAETKRDKPMSTSQRLRKTQAANVKKKVVSDTRVMPALPEKVSIVLTSLAETLVEADVTACEVQDLVSLMATRLQEVELNLVTYTRAIHIKNVQDAFKSTSNPSLAKQVSDLLNFQSNLEDIEINRISFKDIPTQYLRGITNEEQ